MCLPKPKIFNNTTTTAPAPPPAVAQSAAAAQGDAVREGDRDEALKAKRKGRAGLKIRLDAGNTGGGTGINVPRA